MNIATLILAAGKGTRMKSDLAKVLHPINDRAMIHYVIDQAKSIDSDSIVLIVGHQKDQVIKETESREVKYALQLEQLGTGHAVMQAEEALSDFNGSVLILSGDVPLLTAKTLSEFIENHIKSSAKASLLSAIIDDPSGYGRIVRNTNNGLDRIVEHKDANEEILKINEINTGIYLFEKADLFRLLKDVKNNNSQNEYYLPDILPMILKENKEVKITVTQDFDETRGINTIEQLQESEAILKSRNG